MWGLDEMRELLANENYIPQLFEYEEKPLEKGEVRVKCIYGAPKHGTEMTGIKEQPFEEKYYDEEMKIFLQREEKVSSVYSGLGNMWVGTITEVGSDVEAYHAGDQVVGYGNLAQTHTVNAQELLVMPEGMTWKQAMCYDPMQFALSAIRDAKLRLGDTVLISGLGAIGQMAAQAAKAAGASLVAVSDPIEIRRKAALENGADIAFNPLECDMGLELRKLTNGVGVDVVIETSANYKALEQGIRALAIMEAWHWQAGSKNAIFPYIWAGKGISTSRIFSFQGPAASRTGITQGGILTGYAKKAGNCWEQGKYSVRTLYIQL